MLFGGDECQKQLSVSVYIAYNAISLYGQIDPTIYDRLKVTKA